MPTMLQAAGLDTSACDLDGCDLADITSHEHHTRYQDRTVYSEFQRQAQGVYMALNSKWKYFYSAPDRREFLFDRILDPEETRSRAGVTLCRGALDEMREDLFEYYRSVGFTEPLEGAQWKLFPQPTMPADPDAGLLIQDAPWAAPYQAIPGYTDDA